MNERTNGEIYESAINDTLALAKATKNGNAQNDDVSVNYAECWAHACPCRVSLLAELGLENDIRFCELPCAKVGIASKKRTPPLCPPVCN